MAKSTTLKVTQALLIISLTIYIFSFTTLASTTDYHTFSRKLSPRELGLKPGDEKLTHLHFYFHDIVSGRNPTAIKVAEAQTTNSSPTSFGSVYIMDDPLTASPEPNSQLVGRAQGIYAAASQTEFGLLMVLNFVFTEGEYNGSTLSILGRNAVSSAVREMPILGGSGVFRFARGYAQAKTYLFNTSSLDATMEYNVYVSY